jgi:hypothetical protein
MIAQTYLRCQYVCDRALPSTDRHPTMSPWEQIGPIRWAKSDRATHNVSVRADRADWMGKVRSGFPQCHLGCRSGRFDRQRQIGLPTVFSWLPIGRVGKGRSGDRRLTVCKAHRNFSLTSWAITTGPDLRRSQLVVTILVWYSLPVRIGYPASDTAYEIPDIPRRRAYIVCGIWVFAHGLKNRCEPSPLISTH